MSVKLRFLGYKPTKADPDLWMRQTKNGKVKYIARYVDDVISFSDDPLSLMKELEKVYTMKGIGKPQYYLGGDIEQLSEDWIKENLNTAFSAET